MKKSTKKTAKKTAKKTEAKRISFAKQTREQGKTATGARALAKIKADLHPEDPKRATFTRALRTDEAKATAKTARDFTAGKIDAHLRATFGNDYDPQNDKTDNPARVQSCLDYARKCFPAGTPTGTRITIAGAQSNNDKNATLYDLGYWGHWNARQYAKASETGTADFNLHIISQKTDQTDIRHFGDKARARVEESGVK